MYSCTCIEPYIVQPSPKCMCLQHQSLPFCRSCNLTVNIQWWRQKWNFHGKLRFCCGWFFCSQITRSAFARSVRAVRGSFYLGLLYRVLTLIWRFIVKKKRMKKYMTRMGQKTGTLKQSKKVEKTATRVEITVCSLEKVVSHLYTWNAFMGHLLVLTVIIIA